MPDNREGAPPDGVSGAVAGTALATLEAEETDTGQAAPAASAEATGSPPAEEEKPGEQAPPKTAWEEAGFNSPEDMAKSYKELRTKYNERDAEISAARDGKAEMGKLKNLIGLDEVEGEQQNAGTQTPAAAPQQTPGSEDPQNPVENIRTFLGDGTADYVKDLEEKVKSLRGDFDQGRRQNEESRAARIEEAAGEGISKLIGDVGAEEYARVMRNHRFEKFVAKQVLVDGLDPAYVYAGLSAVLNEERAAADRRSSGQAGSGSGGGDALPPGGKPGGTKKAQPKSEAEEAYEGMQETLAESNEDFFAKGLNK